MQRLTLQQSKELLEELKGIKNPDKSDKELISILTDELGVENATNIYSVLPKTKQGRKMAIATRQALERECSNIDQSDKMLIDLLTISYTRSTLLEKLAFKVLDLESESISITKEKLELLGKIYKQIERSHNQYTKHYLAWKSTQNKNPSINIQSTNTVVGKQELHKHDRE